MGYDYQSLLARAHEGFEMDDSDARFSIPEPDVFYEGKRTLIRNFEEMGSVLRREMDHFSNYVLREMGTAGTRDGKRMILQGRLPARKVLKAVQSYAKTYVICHECGKPDTYLDREGRTQMLHCEACGARRPLKAVKAAPAMAADEVKEGHKYDVTIVDMGKRGDGIAKRGGYTLFVPGVIKGAQAKVEVITIRGNSAFCRRTT